MSGRIKTQDDLFRLLMGSGSEPVDFEAVANQVLPSVRRFLDIQEEMLVDPELLAENMLLKERVIGLSRLLSTRIGRDLSLSRLIRRLFDDFADHLVRSFARN